MRLSSGEGWSGLSEFDISESDIIENFENSLDPRKSDEEIERFFDGHPQNFGDGFSFEFHIKGFGIVPTSVTGFALDVHIGEEVHFDLLDSAPLTGFTSSTARIETESSDTIAPLLCLERAREHLTDMGKYARIRGDIGMRCSSDGRLINDDGLVSVFRSLYTFHFPDLDHITRRKFIDEVRSDDIHDE